MRSGLTGEKIVEAAAAIADEKGLAAVSLKAVADALGVKPPALYKHFAGGLEELYRELTLYGWRSAEDAMVRAAVGKSQDDAVFAVSDAFRNYAREHKGLNEAMQRYNMYLSAEDLKATERIVAVLFQILDGYHISEEKKVHTVRTLRAFWQGFTMVESQGGYGNPLPTDDSFRHAIGLIISGIRDLEKK